MLLSILIPVYNVQDYVVECLESVLAQCDEDVEVIVLDDASTDNSLKVVENYISEKKSSILLIRHESNRGLSAARNTMLDFASGEYVWFLDSDDTLCAGAVASLKRIVKHYNPDLIFCDYCVWRPTLTGEVEKGVHVKTFSGESNILTPMSWDCFSGLYRAGHLHSWTKISRRALWQDDVKFQEGIYFEDMVNTPRLMLKAKNYFHTKEIWVNYRQHGASILATPNLAKINDMINGLADVLPLWEREFSAPPHSAIKAYYRFCLKTYRIAIKGLRSANVYAEKNTESQFGDKFFKVIGQSKWGFCKFFLMSGDMRRFVRACKI